MTIKDHILARLALAERDEESLPLGATLRLRELTRAQMRDAQSFAATTDLAERERVRGLALATADLGDEDARRAALTAYWLGAPEQVVNLDRYYAALLAAGTRDPETARRYSAAMRSWHGPIVQPDLRILCHDSMSARRQY
jgi:hypothetical protein